MAGSASSTTSSRPSTPTQPRRAMPTTPSPKKLPRPSASPSSKSPRNPMNTAWVLEQRRQIFLNHLTKWSLNHDSSTSFQGKISLPHTFDDVIELGNSVRCILTNTAFGDLRKPIVIRLFPPQQYHERYKMVVRCGAGWMSARDFFSKEHLAVQQANRHAQNNRQSRRLDTSPLGRSRKLGPKLEEKDTVAIRPLFRSFLRLPLEVQQMILGVAVGKTDMYRPCRERAQDDLLQRYVLQDRASKQPSESLSLIPLATMFKISKSLNQHLVPWVYHTTDFYFELTGFTNFLWQSGPLKRLEIRRITFAFGTLALLHCLRWLAPDPVYLLFQPPINTKPYSLQYLWRCQIQDLAKDLHLAVLTLDIHEIPVEDIPFVVRIVSQAFGGVERLRFKFCTADIGRDDKRLAGLKNQETWRKLCTDWFKRHQHGHWYMSQERQRKGIDDLERDMDQSKEFFDSV